MADNFYKGFNRVLFIKIADEFLPVACLTNNSLNESSDIIDTTVRTNNGWKTSRPTNQSYTIPFEGVQINTLFDGDTTKASYDRLKALKRGLTLFEWQIRTIGESFLDYGVGYISEISEAASVDGFLTFSGLIQGYGEPYYTADVLDSISFDSTLIDWSNTLVTFDNE